MTQTEGQLSELAPRPLMLPLLCSIWGPHIFSPLLSSSILLNTGSDFGLLCCGCEQQLSKHPLLCVAGSY